MRALENADAEGGCAPFTPQQQVERHLATDSALGGLSINTERYVFCVG